MISFFNKIKKFPTYLRSHCTKKRFFYAVEHNDIETVQSFMDKKFDLNVRSVLHGQKNTLLHVACALEHTHILEILLKYANTENINSGNHDNLTPLHVACHHLNVDAVRLLLNQPGIDVNMATFSNKSSPLTLLADTLKIQTITINEKSWLKFPYPDSPGRALFEDQCTNIMTMLLNNGADVDWVDDHGNSAIFYCVSQMHNRSGIYKAPSQLLKILMNKKANVHIKNHKGQTPFEIALENEVMDFFEFLIQNMNEKHKDQHVEYLLKLQKKRTYQLNPYNLNPDFLDLCVEQDNIALISFFMQWFHEKNQSDMFSNIIKEKISIYNGTCGNDILSYFFHFNLENTIKQKDSCSQKRKKI